MNTACVGTLQGPIKNLEFSEAAPLITELDALQDLAYFAANVINGREQMSWFLSKHREIESCDRSLYLAELWGFYDGFLQISELVLG